MPNWTLRILETPQDMASVEEIQRLVWPGSEAEIIPSHLLLTAAHNGGLLVGAYEGAARPFQDELELIEGSAEAPTTRLIGFVFGFPGFYSTPDGPRLKHCSHMLAVHPDYRDQGLGFALKRAQWQMVRRQGIDRITWTYDPLMSRNAFLNIARLGAVCNTYRRNEYGEMRDQLNAGLPTDRFQADWWIHSQRVNRRLSKKARQQLDLAHFLAASVEIINPTRIGAKGLPEPIRPSKEVEQALQERATETEAGKGGEGDLMLLLEIPSDFQAVKTADPALGLEWRLHTRALFEDLFGQGYLVTDFVYLPGTTPRSFYVLSYGEGTL
ncbi:MAG TPA: GNAT family N-acetyltransferase [Anaerolineales bacterium]